VERTAGRLEELGIESPTLVVDRPRAVRNIERMVRRAAKLGVAFRPHFKTHQSRAVGRWFRDCGVTAITVSSVRMARYFAGDGWSDITIAMPVNVRELRAVAELAGDVKLGVLVDSREAVAAIAAVAGARLRVWIKIDTGYGRAGIAWDDEERITSVARAVLSSPRSDLAGILSHNGLTYRERGRDGVLAVHSEAAKRLQAAREIVSCLAEGDCAVSIGDTPAASLVEELPGVDELRPGNFVFCDLTQASIGSCSMEDIAIAVACPVLGVYPERERALLYGGAVHLSLDSLKEGSGGATYGCISLEWPEAASVYAPIVSLSQEHGVAAIPPGGAPAIGHGQLVSVLPVHSCLTCDLHPAYLTLDGERLDTIRGWTDSDGGAG
jgi:D-serine deaminase-like pyridoxal phosphate-dependent protein